MRVPLSWLKEFVNVDASPEELADRLTFSGLEVEGIDVIGSDFKGIVVGEVLCMEPHPQADNLFLCSVHNGQEAVQVVCGAHNFGVGDKVPFAGIGTTLPNGQKIELVKIRGAESRGILCAEDDLGISDDHSGLLILPVDLPAGKRFSELAGPPEPVLVIEVTPNRPDCLSVIGVAREVAALYGKRLKLPSIKFNEAGKSVKSFTTVRVEDTEACPRYTARILSDVSVGPSPLWMRMRLIQCGIRPINNVVDITNYVMLECGQPLHAFDHALLEKGCIVVRRAKPAERIMTLDQEERGLTQEMLLITDAQKAVAVAGVMGGASSGILETTRTVLLESACFKPSVVRKSSRTLGLSTESSYRFEHGVDIQLADWASRRTAALMIELTGAKAARGVIDLFPVKPKERKLVCRFDRVRKLLGMDISDDRISGIFESLMLAVAHRNEKSCAVQVPTFRMDLENEADLIEEVARIHGLDKIPVPAPRCRIVSGAGDELIRAAIRCRSHLVGLGLSEIMNYSFVSEQLLNLFGPEMAGQRVILPRPVSKEYAILRDSLLPQMGETLGRNRSRQVPEAGFFEMGRVFFRKQDKQVTLCEEDRLAIGLMGPVGRYGLNKRKPLTEEDLFLWLKGILESLYGALSVHGDSIEAGGRHAGGPTFRPLSGKIDLAQAFPVCCLEKNREIIIFFDGVPCGILGLLNAAIRKEWRLPEPIAVLEMRLQPVLRQVFETPLVKRPPVYPSVVRDMAIVAERHITHEDIVEAIWNIAPKELTDIELFDIYDIQRVKVGYKSMAYSLTYCSLDRTLTDDEVNTLHTAITAGIRKKIKVEIREG